MFLNNPFPPTSSFRTRLRFSFFAGLVVFLILFLFKPFNIDGATKNPVFCPPMIYGLATFVMVMLNSGLLPIFLKHFYREERWTLWKEILVMIWQVVSISFVNLVITHFLFGDPMNFSTVIHFLLITASVGIFPIALILMIKQQVLYKKFAAAASVIERNLHAAEALISERNLQIEGASVIEKSDRVSVDERGPQTPVISAAITTAPALLRITGENQGEELSILPEDFRFISSADNYLKVTFLENGKLSGKVIRSSLKRAQEMLTDHPSLYRCHRAFIINLAAVEHVSGNAQGFKLQLKNVEELIPVSRSLNDELREKLQKLL
ncbi:MAG: LytTR family DNA-binding domain-containing protein [Chitinophagaceae bacterium]